MRERTPIGKSTPRTEYITELQKAWTDGSLVLFLGTGVSLQYGVPNWRDLVLELLLVTENRFQRFWPEYRSALANWMSSYYDFNLLSLSRVVKYQLAKESSTPAALQQQFAELVRRSLYRVWHTPEFNRLRNQRHRSTTLATLAKLIKVGAERGHGVAAVVTMNFDNFLEQELDRAGVEYHSVCDGASSRGHGLPILHPHGFLPDSGKLSKPELVFSEDEYHQLAHSPFHWAVGEMSSFLRRHTVLFVGLSMTDPTLRRLLDATVARDGEGQIVKPFRRFVIRKDYAAPPVTEHKEIRAHIERLADRKRRELDEPHHKSEDGIIAAVERMASQAHAFDRELFKDMGVGTVWINDYDDLPKVLEKVATPSSVAPRTATRKK